MTIQEAGVILLLRKHRREGKRLNRLKEIRESKALTITELARRSGITRQTITRLENEEDDTANSKTLKALADALEVRVTDFFSG